MSDLKTKRDSYSRKLLERGMDGQMREGKFGSSNSLGRGRLVATMPVDKTLRKRRERVAFLFLKKERRRVLEMSWRRRRERRLRLKCREVDGGRGLKVS